MMLELLIPEGFGSSFETLWGFVCFSLLYQSPVVGALPLTSADAISSLDWQGANGHTMNLIASTGMRIARTTCRCLQSYHSSSLLAEHDPPNITICSDDCY